MTRKQFDATIAAVAYADEMEEKGEYPKFTLIIDDVELFG